MDSIMTLQQGQCLGQQAAAVAEELLSPWGWEEPCCGVAKPPGTAKLCPDRDTRGRLCPCTTAMVAFTERQGHATWITHCVWHPLASHQESWQC